MNVETFKSKLSAHLKNIELELCGSCFDNCIGGNYNSAFKIINEFNNHKSKNFEILYTNKVYLLKTEIIGVL